MEDDIVFRRDSIQTVSHDGSDSEEQDMMNEIDDEWNVELKALLQEDPLEEEPDWYSILYPPKNPWDAPEDSGDEDEFPWEQTSLKRIETIKLLLSKPFDSLMEEDKQTVISFLKRFKQVSSLE